MTEKITSFTQLRTWQKARELASMIYKITSNFPDSEKFGLTSQMRRSVVSVAANIAEGFSRDGQKDKIRFYSIALGSLTETLSHAYISLDLGFLHNKDMIEVKSLVENLQKMIHGMTKTAQARKA